jgi:hypothetical protein
MDVGGPAWDEAMRAWRRIQRRMSGRGPAPDERGNEALHTLSDLSVVRRLLDHVELRSVQRARRHGKSWAEIATNLGITRQSAWERWRDLDAEADTETGAGAGTELGESTEVSTLRATARQIIEESAQELVGRVRRKPTTGPTVPVPDVIGFSAGDAWQVLHNLDLVAMRHNPGSAPLPLGHEAEGVVVDQVPKQGARRRPGSTVTLWVSTDGGSAGVREPRRPAPTPLEAKAENEPGDPTVVLGIAGEGE